MNPCQVFNSRYVVEGVEPERTIVANASHPMVHHEATVKNVFGILFFFPT